MPPNPGASGLDDPDDLVRVGRREAQRVSIDVAELLEEDRLPLHDRERGLGADVAEAEHGRAVADDGDSVLLDRQVPDLPGSSAIALQIRATPGV